MRQQLLLLVHRLELTGRYGAHLLERLLDVVQALLLLEAEHGGRQCLLLDLVLDNLLLDLFFRLQNVLHNRLGRKILLVKLREGRFQLLNLRVHLR